MTTPAASAARIADLTISGFPARVASLAIRFVAAEYSQSPANKVCRAAGWSLPERIMSGTMAVGGAFALKTNELPVRDWSPVNDRRRKA